MTNQTLIDELRRLADVYDSEPAEDDQWGPPEVTRSELRDVSNVMAQAADALSRPTEGCTWIDDEDGPWRTGCGQAFEFLTDGPRENGMRFCCYCGGALRESSGNSGALAQPSGNSGAVNRAVPDLLAAAIGILGELDTQLPTMPLTRTEWAKRTALRHAIAKAGGGSTDEGAPR